MTKTTRLGLTAAVLLAAAAARAADPTVDPAQVYAQNCSACHQPDGKGIPGAFPALAADAFVQGDPAPSIAVVLNGRAGMPTFRDELSDAQIAASLNHVRKAWGDQGPPIDAATVAKLRGAPAGAAKIDVLPGH